eukprot:6175629-Pleurochrysis_carterae.AAC.1
MHVRVCVRSKARAKGQEPQRQTWPNMSRNGDEGENSSNREMQSTKHESHRAHATEWGRRGRGEAGTSGLDAGSTRTYLQNST